MNAGIGQSGQFLTCVPSTIRTALLDFGRSQFGHGPPGKMLPSTSGGQSGQYESGPAAAAAVAPNASPSASTPQNNLFKTFVADILFYLLLRFYCLPARHTCRPGSVLASPHDTPAASVWFLPPRATHPPPRFGSCLPARHTCRPVRALSPPLYFFPAGRRVNGPLR